MQGVSIGPLKRDISDGAICIISGFQVSNTRDFTMSGGDSIATLSASATPDIFETGTPVQLENSGGFLPTGLSGNSVFYTIFVSATEVRFAETYANALAGIAVVPSNAGSGTHTVSVAIKDQSGNQCHGMRGSGLTEAELWGTANFMSTVTGTSNDTIELIEFNNYWDSPANQTLLFFWRWIVPGFPLATSKRFFGNGESSSSKGLRIRTHSSSSGKFQAMIGSSTSQYSGASTANYGHASNVTTLAFVFDGPSKRLLCFVDGAPDTGLREVVLTGDLAEMLPFGQTMRLGGNSSDSSGANWQWFHAYRKNGPRPENINDIVKRLHERPVPLTQSEWSLAA